MRQTVRVFALWLSKTRPGKQATSLAFFLLLAGFTASAQELPGPATEQDIPPYSTQINGFGRAAANEAAGAEPLDPAALPSYVTQIRGFPPPSEQEVAEEIAVQPDLPETETEAELPEPELVAESQPAVPISTVEDAAGETAEPESGSITLGGTPPPAASGVPPGFEALVGGQSNIPPGFEAFFQEQTTQVDVYYGGLYVTSLLATYSPNTLEFLNPEELVMEIPGIADIEGVTQALSGPVPNNANIRCIGPQQANCGSIDPEVAGVIFNSGNYRADVFVNPDYLALQTQQVNRYLGASSAGFSAFQTLNYTFSGADDQNELNQNLTTRLLISKAENSLQISANYNNNDDWSMDEFIGRRDWQGVRYQAGIIRNYGTAFQFGRQFDTLGFSANTSLDTREDLRFSTGSALEVFLPLQSVVSLYVDGRLVTTQTVDPGNQQLNTTSLPGGSYDVEIRIRDATGERTETRFYTKSSRLPPEDTNLYNFALGYLRDSTSDNIFATENNLVWRAGYRARLTETSAWRVGIAGTSDDLLNQIGWFGTSSWYELNAEVAAATDQRYGGSFDIRVPVFGTTFYSNYRRIWNKDGYDLSQGAYLLGPTSTQMSAGISLPLWEGSLSLSARKNERVDQTIETYSLDYRMPAWRWGPASLSPRLSLTNADGSLSAVLSLDFRQNADDWQFSANLRQEQFSDSDLDNPSQTSAQARADWNSGDRWVNNLQANFGVDTNSNQDSLSASADFRSGFGRARLDSQYIQGQDSDNRLNYSGSYTTSLIYVDQGVAFGGRDQNSSAIVIDLTGSVAEDVYFDVMVDGNAKGTAIPGRRTVIAVSPYQNYDVRLEAKGSGFVSFQNDTKQATVYPGNAVALSWEITQIDVVFGRILDAEGNPVRQALIHGVEGLAVTDDYGNFQAEMSPQTSELQVETVTSTCDLVVPAYTTRSGIGLLGDFSCTLRPK